MQKVNISEIFFEELQFPHAKNLSYGFTFGCKGNIFKLKSIHSIFNRNQ